MVEFWPMDERPPRIFDPETDGSITEAMKEMAEHIKTQDTKWREEAYVASRADPIERLKRRGALVENETAVPSELPEVVNLARDYDRWDQYEAPPPLED